jgi:hypothetical protein
MGLFGFGKNKTDNSETYGQGLLFGRYTDCNKTKKQLDHWDASVKFFGEKHFLKAIEEFLYYIKDEAQNNVSVKAGTNNLEFTIIQGSKFFTGKVENGILEVQGRIAGFTNPPVPVMRKLLSLNYALRYTWCGIKDDNFGIYFTTEVENTNAWKLYSAFRELALNIDKQDDLLIEEFEGLKALDTEEIIPISDHLVKQKVKYMKQWIAETLEQIKQSDQQKHNGLNSYRLLALCLRIDYLLSPQGGLMDKIEKILNMYFKRPQGANDINSQIIQEFTAIADIDESICMKSFYNVKATFALAPASTYKQVADFVFEESKTRDYYLKNNEAHHIPIIYEYIAGYNLFYFGMKHPLTDVNKFYLRVLHSDFFRDVSSQESLYDKTTGKLNKMGIIKEIDEILKNNRKNHPTFTFNHSKLNFNNISDFAMSYFTEFDFLNVN